MRGTLIVIYPDGELTALQMLARPKLEDLQAFVGGYVEPIPGFDTLIWDNVVMNVVAFCNEEGSRQELRPNANATVAWEDALRRRGELLPEETLLLGSVVVLFGDKEFMAAL